MANRYGLQIRAATHTDAAGLSELLATSGVTATGEAVGARLEALHRSGAGTALIAVEWGPPSGLIVVNWVRTLRADASIAHVDMLFVAPDDRRRGIARLLLKAAAQSARSAGCDELVIAVREASLHAFCEANGFERSGQAYARALRKKS